MYTWYQTNTYVGIEIHHYLKDEKDLKINFSPKRVELSFPIFSSSDYELGVDLFDEIIPQECRTSV